MNSRKHLADAADKVLDRQSVKSREEMGTEKEELCILGDTGRKHHL